MSENGMVACRLVVRGMLAKKRWLDAIVKVQLPMGLTDRRQRGGWWQHWNIYGSEGVARKPARRGWASKYCRYMST